MYDRRSFLTGAASAGLALSGAALSSGVLSGCSRGGLLGPTVTVAVPWSGTELSAFRSVLRALHPSYHVELVPLGDDIGTVFSQPASRRPDVVLLPQPGLVAEHLARLAPLPADLTKTWPYDAVWDSLLCHGGYWYGVPFKIAHKSAVWYRRSALDALGGATAPSTWSEWLQLNAALAGAGIPALALAGADGWSLTDFFENVLAGLAPGAYDDLARPHGPRLHEVTAVSDALQMLGDMWAVPGVLADGVRRSLVRQFDDAVIRVFGHRRAAMVVLPDFAQPLVRRFAKDPADIGMFRFPAVVEGEAGNLPLVIGGDVAVLTEPVTDDAADLVRSLARPNAPLPWITGVGGFLAAHINTPPDWYRPPLNMLAADLAPPLRGPVRFDLSDQLGPVGGSGGLWRVLQDFLVRVGGGAEVTGAVVRAMDQLAGLGG
jgi:alpha-glucoside transport system substrate-binding protein